MGRQARWGSGPAAILGAAAIVLPASAQAADGARIDWQGDLLPLCGERASCMLIDAFDAGTTGDGDPLLVIELGFDEGDLPDYLQGGWGCRFDPDGFDGGREFWLLGDGAPRLVLKLCNDGYGAAQVGEDRVTIGDGTLEALGYGGSAWRWESWGVLDLEEMALLRGGSCTAYGAWTWSVEAADWTVPRMLQAWHPMPDDAADGPDGDWCPELDASSPWPEAPDGYGLGLSVPAYAIAGHPPRDLGSCGQPLTTGDDVSVAGGDPLFRLALFAGEPPVLVIEGAASLFAGAGIDVAWASSPLSALEMMGPDDTVATAPYTFGRTRLDLSADGGASAGWIMTGLPDGRAVITIALPDDRDAYYEGLPGGMAVAVLSAGGDVLATTVPWRDGAPVFTPSLAFQGRRGGGCRVTDGVGEVRPQSMLPGDVRQWQ